MERGLQHFLKQLLSLLGQVKPLISALAGPAVGVVAKGRHGVAEEPQSLLRGRAHVQPLVVARQLWKCVEAMRPIFQKGVEVVESTVKFGCRSISTLEFFQEMEQGALGAR